MSEDQRDWLKRRIQQLRSRMQTVGPFRQAGISRTIAGMQDQLHTNTWKPHP